VIKLSTRVVAQQTVSGLHDGRGTLNGGRALDRPALGGGAWQFVDYWRLPPGTSIGEHLHVEGYELYFVTAGRGVMTTNGVASEVAAGDLILNEPGDRHMLENTGEEALTCLVTAVIDAAKG